MTLLEPRGRCSCTHWAELYTRDGDAVAECRTCGALWALPDAPARTAIPVKLQGGRR